MRLRHSQAKCNDIPHNTFDSFYKGLKSSGRFFLTGNIDQILIIEQNHVGHENFEQCIHQNPTQNNVEYVFKHSIE